MSLTVRLFWRDQRGAVMAEGAVVLPALILVLAGLYFLHDLHAARLRVTRVVRECSWQYCGQGCDEQERHRFPRCRFADRETPSGLGSKGKAFRQAVQNASASSRNSFKFIDVLGRENTTSAAVERKASRYFGGSTHTVGSSMTLLCNEASREPLDVVKDAFCSLTDLC